MRLLPVLLFLLFIPAFQAFGQNQGYTLNEDLIYRINFGSAEDVRVLLGKGADPNARTRQGESALEVAIARNDAESAGMAAALIDKGADINAVDKAGNAAIVNAIHYKQPMIVKALLAKGVDYHTHTADGTTLIDYAKQNNDTESEKMIAELLSKEEAYNASMRSSDRFKGMLRDYTMDSCVYQYWHYFLSSHQAPEKDDDTNKKIVVIKNAISEIIANIQKYYPTSSNLVLQRASTEAVNQIFAQLDSMISNRNRAENGVGHDEDAKVRCDKIVESMNINYVPAATGTTPSPAPSATPVASPAPKSSEHATPLPMVPLETTPGAPKAP